MCENLDWPNHIQHCFLASLKKSKQQISLSHLKYPFKKYQLLRSLVVRGREGFFWNIWCFKTTSHLLCGAGRVPGAQESEMGSRKDSFHQKSPHARAWKREPSPLLPNKTEQWPGLDHLPARSACLSPSQQTHRDPCHPHTWYSP